jgi:hypothetical protein
MLGIVEWLALNMFCKPPWAMPSNDPQNLNIVPFAMQHVGTSTFSRHVYKCSHVEWEGNYMMPTQKLGCGLYIECVVV